MTDHNWRAVLGRAVRPTAFGMALLLSGCSLAPGSSAPPNAPASVLVAASSGVCSAIAALPDRAAAERAFTNLAHAALHALAADARLDRSLAARVLETMQKVETDFSQSAGATLLGGDLAQLEAAAVAALSALGQEVPACAA
jgi:hypothetical protein